MIWISGLLFISLWCANLYLMFGSQRDDLVGEDLRSERLRHRTRLNGYSFAKEGRSPEPPQAVYRFVRYPSGEHQLGAYISPDPGGGRRLPAVIWAHGGFGGISEFCWTLDDDQSPRAFLNADFVVMCPSWRAENDNAGRYEQYYGEVDDILAAVKYLKSLSYVDSSRIYIVGYSAGGTLALLAAQMSDEFRAAFSFGGAADMTRVLADGKGYGDTPFDIKDRTEVRLRDPMQFVDSIKVPIYFIEGGGSWFAADGCRMEKKARKKNRHFTATIVPGANHWSVLQPLCLLIADKIRQDTNAVCNISIPKQEARKIFLETPQPHQKP